MLADSGSSTPFPGLDYARSIPPCQDPEASYTVRVPAHDRKPAREAQVVMAWAQVTIPAPSKAPAEVRRHCAIRVWVLRVWEPNPPAGTEPVEWVLLSSLPITTVAGALRIVDWYTCRWLCEDYHQCLKTGCRAEDTQLDNGEDIRRLLGFLAPIAVRLLQLRQGCSLQSRTACQGSGGPADGGGTSPPRRREQRDADTMTALQFWQTVARLGGHQGRRRDGPPGWRTLWKGWRYLVDLTEGARLFPMNGPSS